MSKSKAPQECPALHRLRGAMGVDSKGRMITPAHLWVDGRCGHCGISR